MSTVVSPPNDKPYRLTVYVLDYDRNGRSNQATVTGAQAVLDTQDADVKATAQGVYLSWTVTGTVELNLANKGGTNVTASAVFVDTK